MSKPRTKDNVQIDQPSPAPPLGSARDPLMPYDDWRALGPEKAAEYLANRRGYTAKEHGTLWALLETFWEREPNAGGDP